jgi:intracellular sulfur oxidation DsrE/DsrF family protein
MKKIALFVFTCLLSGLMFAQDKVVYHFDQAEVQALKGLRNIRNQLEAAPDTKIIVVTHALGVDLLMQGARDQVSKTEYAPLISDLKAKGVVFEVCEYTMKNRGLSKDQFILEADFTPSGVVRITRLQSKEGFAYLKP